MERVEYTTNGNRLGISIKYPNEINRKWSECICEVECSECSSENLSSSVSGEILTIVCQNCANYWYGSVNKVLTWHETEEALVSTWNIPFREEPNF